MTHAIACLAVILYSLFVYRFIRSLSPDLKGVLVCVLFGIGAGVAAIGLEFSWNYLLGDFISSHHALIFLESFVGVALIEELCKWLFFVIIISRWKKFDTYTDGILYACGIAAGFNLIEGNIYAYVEVNHVDMLIRSITAVPAHFFFGIVMGYLFSRHQLDGPGYLWASLFIPAVLHGLYDFFILQQYAELLIGAALLVLIGCLSLSVWVCRMAMRADKISAVNHL